MNVIICNIGVSSLRVINLILMSTQRNTLRAHVGYDMISICIFKEQKGGGFKASYVVFRSLSKPSHFSVSISHRSVKSRLLKPLDVALLLQDVALRPYPSVTSLSLYRAFLSNFEESDYGFRLVKYDHPLFSGISFQPIVSPLVCPIKRQLLHTGEE